MGGFVNKVIALRQSVRVIRYASVLSVCYMCCSGLAALNMTKAAGEGTFMYFAFGSNLLKERLQLANPSATFLATGRLKDYKLDFGLWGTNVENNWHGGVATIRESPGSEVWGVIWTLNNDNVDSLDEQEGVEGGMYSPMEVLVESSHGPIMCRTYQMNNFHACLPSPQYKHVVCWGAEQNGLPVEYRSRLEALEANNYRGPSILDSIKTDGN
ncbi:gamma-glutamylcyclotransferase a isoform X1 [Dunckerocampus dactyliophorus]|uniref:gamma-glutamylcyclotransferase a isoform X1 n=1 Tax=Dunckerocampus dactyliophorus TaxID=161453 RepID=UPI002404A2ED|nr:gamma-glutamylcyclotransferase a isoform X1 [Dunckerocampus dactyliophorus]